MSPSGLELMLHETGALQFYALCVAFLYQRSHLIIIIIIVLYHHCFILYNTRQYFYYKRRYFGVIKYSYFALSSF